MIPESEKAVLAKVWAPFFFFSVLIPFALFAETSEPFASFLVGIVMSLFVPLVQLPVLVQMVVGWGQSREEGLVLLLELVPEPVVVVLVPVEWVWPVPILLPAIIPMALVSGPCLPPFLPLVFRTLGWKQHRQPSGNDGFHHFPFLLYPRQLFPQRFS
mgnify:CR=1 FL=1